MGKLKWNRIRAELKAHCAPPGPKPRESFWASFRAQAQLVNRDDHAAAARPPLAFRRPLAWAAAAAVGVAFAVFVTLSQNGGNAQPPQLASAIEEIEVFVPYSTMMIMQDDSGASMVWLADVQIGKDG